MAHWGWYWNIKKKHIAKKLCSNLVQIDSFKICKNGIIRDFYVLPVQIIAKAYPDCLKITYRDCKSNSYHIAVDKLACNYGGLRCFFRCPLCQRRMRLLYLAENSIFLCRKCLNLSYKSQRLRPTRRYDYMSQKIDDFIKSKGGDLSFYQKPPKMHQKTYQRLKDDYFNYESKYRQALGSDLREWFGARAEPYVDDF